MTCKYIHTRRCTCIPLKSLDADEHRILLIMMQPFRLSETGHAADQLFETGHVQILFETGHAADPLRHVQCFGNELSAPSDTGSLCHSDRKFSSQTWQIAAFFLAHPMTLLNVKWKHNVALQNAGLGIGDFMFSEAKKKLYIYIYIYIYTAFARQCTYIAGQCTWMSVFIDYIYIYTFLSVAVR